MIVIGVDIVVIEDDLAEDTPAEIVIVIGVDKVVIEDDLTEDAPAESVQCGVCVASLPDEIHPVLHRAYILDTDGQGQVCFHTR